MRLWRLIHENSNITHVYILTCIVPCMQVYILIHYVYHNKRWLHDIFHIGPGISPRLPYQGRQRSWSADMGRGFFLSHILHWPFPSIDFYIAKKIFELTNYENKFLRELPLFNLQIFLFRVWFQKYTKQCRSVQWR